MPEQGRQKGIIGKELGIAFIGAGRMGSQRASIAATHPAVRFLAIADVETPHAPAPSGGRLTYGPAADVGIAHGFTGDPEILQVRDGNRRRLVTDKLKAVQ